MKVLCILVCGCLTLQRVQCQVCVVVCDVLALGVSAGTDNVEVFVTCSVHIFLTKIQRRECHLMLKLLSQQSLKKDSASCFILMIGFCHMYWLRKK